MERFFKSRFFKVLIFIAVLLCLLSLTNWLTGGRLNFIQNAVGVVFTPIQKAAGAIYNGAAGVAGYFTQFNQVKDEIEALKRENAELHQKNDEYALLEEENQFLRSFLDLSEDHPDYVFADARVIGRESGNWFTVFTIDRGQKHGVAKYDPVITADGLVGYVMETGYTWSKVATVIDSGSSVGAAVFRTGDTGVVRGDYSLMLEGRCMLSFIDKDARLQIGDTVRTSGLGELYPRGLVIGTIEDILPEQYGISVYAVIKPAADLSDLERVMVITAFDGQAAP